MFIWIEITKNNPWTGQKKTVKTKVKVRNGKFHVNLINYYFTFSKITTNFTVFRKFQYWFCYYELSFQCLEHCITQYLAQIKVNFIVFQYFEKKLLKKSFFYSKFCIIVST